MAEDNTPRKEVRAEVREIMAAAPDRKFTLEMIAKRINDLHMSLPVPQQLVEDHVTWNFQKGYVDSNYNHELGRDEYFLTDKGKRMEKVGGVI